MLGRERAMMNRIPQGPSAKQSQFPCTARSGPGRQGHRRSCTGILRANKANLPARTRNGKGLAAAPGETPWGQACETKPIAGEPEATQMLWRERVTMNWAAKGCGETKPISPPGQKRAGAGKAVSGAPPGPNMRNKANSPDHSYCYYLNRKGIRRVMPDLAPV